MRVLKWILGLVLALGAVLVVGGMIISPTFKVTRSVTINAPVYKIYALIADPRRWKEWTVWNQRDPQMEITYPAPPNPATGKGAGWSWKSKTEGDGRMAFTSVDPGKQLGYELFFPDFGTTSTGELVLEKNTAGGIRLSWTMNGNMGNNPLFRWMALFADGMVGKDFEAGLSNLKALAEKP